MTAAGVPQARVRSLAQRVLAPMSNYRAVAPGEPAPAGLSGLRLAESEALIGVYTNTPGSLEDSVVVTSHGLHLRREPSWLFVAYADIAALKPPSKTRGAASVIACLRQGDPVVIPIRGGRGGRFRDVYEFTRFVLRVIRLLTR